jgi:nitrate reductase NapE component
MMSNALEEKQINSETTSPFLKWPAAFISYIFHPIFIPLYAIWFIVYIHPSYFSGFSAHAKNQTILIIALNLVFFPLLSVVLLKALGFIQSIFLKTQKDRIIPYIACGIFFFWGYTVFKEQHEYPSIIASFIFGIFLASSAALIANIYFKISMHAIGVGGLLGLFIVIAQSNTMLMTWPLCAALLIAGLVCTSRLLISNHTQKEIYSGIFVGLISQLIAVLVVL